MLEKIDKFAITTTVTILQKIKTCLQTMAVTPATHVSQLINPVSVVEM